MAGLPGGEHGTSTGSPAVILAVTAAEQAFNQAHNVNNCQAAPCGARWALWPGVIVVNPPDNSALAMTPSSSNVYDAKAHSEYDVNGGQTIFVSYSRSTPAPFSSEVRFVAVEVRASK